MTPHYADDKVTLYAGDCLDVLRELPDASVDAVVTDPPYGLEFMGKAWDKFGEDSKARAGMSGTGYTDGAERLERPSFLGGLNPKCRNCSRWQRGGNPCTCDAPSFPNERRARSAAFGAWCDQWTAECLRVLKPGGHLLAFGGTRTWHRLACAVEDAGFEVRDSIAWLYSQGFPKSLNASAALAGRRCTCGGTDASPSGITLLEQERGTDLPGLRDGLSPVTVEAQGGPSAGLLAAMPRETGRGPSGCDSSLGTAEAGALRAEVRPSEPSMERRGDLQAAEGQLHRSEVRPLPSRAVADGEGGRLHHGAPPSDGALGGSDAPSVGSGEPHQPRPAGQPTGEPRALSDERRPQAWGGWPVCERCAQPVVPEGLGTALKPGHEPIVVARKPLAGTVAANVLAHGTGALNIDGCRVGEGGGTAGADRGPQSDVYGDGLNGAFGRPVPGLGRWPANVVLDETQADALDQQSGELTSGNRAAGRYGLMGYMGADETDMPAIEGDSGGASRFFYTAKADSSERVRVNGVAHPTVKPLSLMRWLVRLVTPPSGTVLEPFAGSGTTVEACILEGFRCVAIEREADYLPLIVQRIHRRRDPVQAVRGSGDDGGLFDLLEVERVEPPADTRAGEASAGRRYTDKGSTNFALRPGRRYGKGGVA